MGEIRDNFKKAMSEMFGVGAEDTTPTQPTKEPAKEVAQPAMEPEVAPVAAPQRPDFAAKTVVPEPAPVPAPQVPFAPPQVSPTVEETYISKDTVITGDIKSGSNLRIRGQVAGNIVCDSDVKLYGKLDGNLTGKNALVEGGQIVGNVDVRGDLRVQSAARIQGDLQCANLDLDSEVNGNLRTQHKSVFHANATVVGNIATQTIVVEEGAMIEGYVSMKDMQSMVGRPHLNRD